MARRITTILVLIAITCTSAWGESFWSDVSLDARLGFNLGGTSPVGLPASVRTLNKYNLQPSLAVGVDALKPIKGRWGVMTGLYVENKGMGIDAEVKNYHTAVVQGGESLAGMFTGNVVVNERQIMVTLPVLATYTLTRNINLKAGPYLSCVFNHQFKGNVYGGYMRIGDPTGAKVDIGTADDQRGYYDFSDNMRVLQYGLNAGLDWYVAHRIGVSADLKWGLNGVQGSDFKTIEQTLYPLYGSIGVIYKFK